MLVNGLWSAGRLAAEGQRPSSALSHQSASRDNFPSLGTHHVCRLKVLPGGCS